MTAYPNREKFTVEDVRRNRALYEFAIRYARDYRGEFQFLRNARDTLEAAGRLPEHIAKGVLNCMLYDSTVVFPDTVESDQPKLQLAPVIPIRDHFPVEATIKKRWITSQEHGAKVSHLIDHDLSHAYYHRVPHEICFYVVTLCNTRWQSMRYTRYMSNPSRLLSDQPLFPPCKRCALKEDR